VEAIAAFQVRMAAEMEGLKLDEATVRAGVRASLDGDANGTYWVAEEDGRPVGCLLIQPDWSDWRTGTIGWVHSLYVAPERRGQGTFRALYGEVKRLVEADDAVKGLRLYVATGNEAARRAYEAVGMEAGRYVVYEWMKDGEH
jgi:GNAT superfamily N-acetyltransferase